MELWLMLSRATFKMPYLCCARDMGLASHIFLCNTRHKKLQYAFFKQGYMILQNSLQNPDWTSQIATVINCHYRLAQAVLGNFKQSQVTYN